MKKYLMLIVSGLLLSLVLAGCGPKKIALSVTMTDYTYDPLWRSSERESSERGRS